MEMLSDVNWGIIAPLILLQFVLFVVALVDWVKVNKTNGPKWVWLLIILFISVIGPILYFVFGRRDA